MKKISHGTLAIVIIVLVIIIDQASKIWVKTSMPLGGLIEITGWFKIYFIENNGMAFGLEVIGKLFLSVFRIIAVGGIAYYLYSLVKQKYPKGFIACIALIWAGAFGNIIDSVFYGKLFTASYPGHVATFAASGEGYADWLHGKVVDMLSFPLIDSTFPSWFPFWGGENFIFFGPIFNIADSAITVGLFAAAICYYKTLGKSFDQKPKK